MVLAELLIFEQLIWRRQSSGFFIKYDEIPFLTQNVSVLFF
jgi:hypothetical protein